MKNKKIFLIAGSFAGLFVAASIAVGTAAWFAGRDNIITNDKLGGSVLQSYFHAGDGSEENPFTITTPWHYENFVKLHYNVKGFAQKGYFFEFGDLILGSTTPVFYKTDSHGVVDRNQTSEELDLGGKILPPLGTNTQPYFAQVNGNDLTVKNFTINGSGYNDVGIFGYVASSVSTQTGETQQAMINGCYWSDFIVETKGSIKTAFPHSTDPGKHDDKVEVGYLAGHVVNADSFTDCYINNCEIKGAPTQDAQNNTYSYYGKAEIDAKGGDTSKGHNYKYHLDSEAIYRSVNRKYETYKNAPIRARTEVDTSTGKTIQYADYTTPINGEMPEVINSVTKYPTSGALTQYSSNQYNLTGASRGTSATRNYSFSSLGFQPLTSNSSVREYECFYEDNGQKAMPENVTRKTDWDTKNYDFTAKDQINIDKTTKSILQTKGDYHFYDSGKGWQYVHNENNAADATSGKSVTFNLSCASSFTIDCYIAAWNSPSIKEARAYFYVDGERVVDDDIKSGISVSRISWSGNASFSNVKLKTTSVTRTLQRGRHYYALFILFRMNVNSCKYIKLYDASSTLTSGTSVSYDNDGNYNVTQGTFTLTQDMYDSSSRVVDINASSYDEEYIDSDTSLSYDIDTNAYSSATDMPVYINSNTKQYTLKGKFLKDGTIITLSDSSMLWKKESGTKTEYDDKGNPIEVYWYRWIAYYTPTIEVDYNAITEYFADDPNITTWWDEEGNAQQGYSYQNIDIVGGGISFYYRNFPLIGYSFEVISIRAESSTAYSCYSVPAADITAHKPFYATKYCPTSIVLYLKNTANAADDADHELGNISFEYVNLKYGATSLINLSVPSFKKGSGVFQAISEFGEEEPGGGTLNFRTTFNCTINESGAKKCSYCALDKNRNIIGVFDSNGKPSTGFLDSSGNVMLDKLLAIDTYVLALGTNSNLDINTWVTNIDFEYKAKDGYGGTFGTVGYRSRTDKIDSTILNFYYDLEELTGTTGSFSIKVEFIKGDVTIGDVTYSGYYKITCSSSKNVTLQTYNYDSAHYFLKINNNNYYGEKNTLTITPS